MPKTVTVTLGGQAYMIQAMPIRQTRLWRQKLGSTFGELAEFLARAGAIELTNLPDLSSVIQVLNRTVVGSVDLLLDLLFEFAELRQDRERIEAEAYDDEALRAFVQVLGLAYPFGELAALLPSATGAKTKPTK